MNIRTFVAKSRTFVAKSAIWFSENEGGGQRPFATFLKIHSFWWRHLSLISSIIAVHRKRYLPIYIKSYQSISINTTRHRPDTTRHAPDTIRHGPDTTRHHQMPPHMHNVWFVWSKTSYSGDKWRFHRCGVAQTTTSKDRATQLLICEQLSFAM